MKSNFLIALGLALLSLAVGADQMRAASPDFTARIWDATTGRELTVLRGHMDAVRSAAFSPDGKRIVTASYDRTARIWDAATGKEITILRGHETIGDVRRLQSRRLADRHGFN